MTIDILVNNAGIVSKVSQFVDTRKEEWDREIDVNLKGMLNCCQAIVGHMLGRKSGKIINIASGAGKSGAAGRVAYSASKGGVIALTKALALGSVCQRNNRQAYRRSMEKLRQIVNLRGAQIFYTFWISQSLRAAPQFYG